MINLNKYRYLVVKGIPTKDVKDSLLKFAKEKGVPVYSKSFDKRFEDYPHIIWNREELCGGSPGALFITSATVITIDELIEAINDYRKVEVPLTSDYTAKIDSDQKIVAVGCQKIPFERVEELYKTIQQLKK